MCGIKILECETQSDGAELVRFCLSGVFFCPIDMGKAEAGIAPGRDGTKPQVADQVLLVDAMTVAKQVSVQKLSYGRPRPGTRCGASA